MYVNLVNLNKNYLSNFKFRLWNWQKKDKYCDENSPLNPVSLYGRTKNDAEKMSQKGVILCVLD